MKYLTIIYRWFTARCVYCGNKKKHYDIWGGFASCPTDMENAHMSNPRLHNGCSKKKKFIKPKEAKVQRALGLLSGPKGVEDEGIDI